MTCLYGMITDKNRLLIQIGIRKSNLNNYQFYQAMIDTGATHTAISNNIIKKLNIDEHREVSVYNMHESKETKSYLLDLFIKADRHTLLELNNIEVLSFKALEEFDIILGMDILANAAILSISGDRKFILCF